MDYTTLRDITETIIKVIQGAVGAGTSVLPSILKTDNGIGFYLFHVQENSHYKNYPAQGNDPVPAKYTPMALNLFYQLSANWKSENPLDVYEEQKLMNDAMKALHDTPEIRRTVAGKDVHIKITLQNLSPSESIQYWAASENSVKLSAYYEVSVVFLEPEQPSSYAGRVLNYGNYVFLMGSPRITGTENTISFTDPDLNPRQVIIQPAQAPADDTDPVSANSIVNIRGSGFLGEEIEVLLIRSFGTDDNKYIEPLPNWNVEVQGDNLVRMVIRQNGRNRKTGANIPIVPGMYAVQITVIKRRTIPGGAVKEFRQTSNQFPFSVMPLIGDPVSLGPDSFRVSGNLFVYNNAADPGVKAEVNVIIGSDTLFEIPVNPAEDAVFNIVNAGTLQMDTTNLDPGTKPLRIMVNGIESEPKWITIT